MDKYIHLLCCTVSLAVVLSLRRRDRNRMDSYRVITVDVSEFPIVSGARGPWQQQWCDFFHFHDEWWSSVPPSVVVFSWVHAITIYLPKWKNHCEESGCTQEINLSILQGVQYGTWIKMDALMIYNVFQTFGKSDKWGETILNVLHINVVPCDWSHVRNIGLLPLLLILTLYMWK